jgi:hypothetical protein
VEIKFGAGSLLSPLPRWAIPAERLKARLTPLQKWRVKGNPIYSPASNLPPPTKLQWIAIAGIIVVIVGTVLFVAAGLMAADTGSPSAVDVTRRNEALMPIRFWLVILVLVVAIAWAMMNMMHLMGR